MRLRKEPSTQERAFDGLILMGGLDIHPSRYDASLEVESQFDPARDALDIGWLEHAKTHQIPVMGICRGLQMNLESRSSLPIKLLRRSMEEPCSVRIQRSPLVAISSRMLRRLGWRLGREEGHSVFARLQIRLACRKQMLSSASHQRVSRTRPIYNQAESLHTLLLTFLLCSVHAPLKHL